MQNKGYAIITSPRGTIEYDTATCCHCNSVWAISENLGGWCRQCMKTICPQCVGKECVPLEKALKAYEDKMNFNREFENWQ
jgi:hypothetical protein